MNDPRVTAFLNRIGEGDRDAWNDLLEVVYSDLRAAAERHFRAVPAHATLQPTALVHEAWSRLAEGPDQPFNDRRHFLAVASMIMRSILVDKARAVKTQKRGGDRERVSIDAAELSKGREVDLLDLHAALEELQRLNQRQADVVTMRFFGGLTVETIADALGVSKRTIENDWRIARAWLSVRLG
ncbi:MAG: sigma-70 family RNA polymerase sigma factor [Planctomycetes bacterium]|nr:sigma-70 family RNA polymerase sigma factor [Planctomycetota bacterium]MCB9892108.1 sigma-70 family RNA polymerase sigma factor [Planctomycetota bacterium]